jgi:hypothetical protein
VAHLEVVAPQDAERVLELSAREEVDPLLRRPSEADPTPELTRLFESLVREALSELSRSEVPPPTSGRASIQVAYVPPAPGDEGLEQEVLQMARVAFLNPGLSEKEAAALAASPSGLIVRRDVEKVLRQGDLIMAVNGEPALPQRLARARQRTDHCALRVRRGTEERDIPCP